MMRALTATGMTVSLSEVAEPAPQRNQALIEVEAVSVNRGEVAALASAARGTGWGWGAGGRVRAAAPDGSGPPEGTRVVGLSLPPGAWAEVAAIDTSRLSPVPDGV